MIVKCIESFGVQISENKIYIVIEIYLNYSRQTLRYRIIDNTGCPIIYDSEKFVLVSGDLSGFKFILEESSVTLVHHYIKDSYLNERHIEGFWGVFFETDDNESLNTIKKVVKEISKKEGVAVPKVYKE